MTKTSKNGHDLASKNGSRLKKSDLSAALALPEGGLERHSVIKAPRISTAAFTIIGTAPYVQNKWSAKAREIYKKMQEAGSVGKKGKKREGKDFQACYEDAQHKSGEGWVGIPAGAFRSAMIGACRMVGFKMTYAKLSVFIEADGFDADDGTPLVKITKGKPHYHEATVRNDNGGADIRARPMWDPGWEAVVKVRYDEDQFSFDDVSNLLLRAGLQAGIGEGRADSRDSCGMGWGEFRIREKHEAKG